MDYDILRAQKIYERDRLVEKYRREIPELAEIDAEQQQLMTALTRELIRDNKKISDIDETYRTLQDKKEKILQEHGLDLNIYQPQWDCPICEDRGYTEPGHACVCRLRRLRDERMLKAGLPENFATMTFENFDLSYYNDPEDMKNKCRRLKQFVAKLKAGEKMGNLLLRGDVGRGKTHLSLAVANAVLRNGQTVQYAHCDGLMDDIRNDLFGDDNMKRSDTIARVLSADLFILDDLGRESVSEFVITQLTYIIETRNEENKSWIINTNLRPDEIESLYGARLADRIFAKCSVFRLESENSIRLSKKDKGVTMI